MQKTLMCKCISLEHTTPLYSKLPIKSRDGSLYGTFQFIYFLSPYVELWNVSLETSDRVGDTIDREQVITIMKRLSEEQH